MSRQSTCDQPSGVLGHPESVSQMPNSRNGTGGRRQFRAPMYDSMLVGGVHKCSHRGRGSSSHQRRGTHKSIRSISSLKPRWRQGGVRSHLPAVGREKIWNWVSMVLEFCMPCSGGGYILRLQRAVISRST